MRAEIVSLALAWAVVAGGTPVRGDEPAGPASRPFLAEGRDGLVVGLTGKRAVHSGLEILKQGGGAADAAMATAMTQVVEAAGSYVSFAGILSLVYYDATTQTFHYLNAGYNTPIEETDPLSIPKMDPLTGVGTPSGRTALVPGFMAGVQAARDRFGKLPMARIVEPAIALAEDGFEVDPLLAGWIQYRKGVLSRLPETKRTFTRGDGAFHGRGDRFRQPALAATLRQVAERGAGVMYTGDWAHRFVDAVRRDGGKITLRDLETYRVTWEAPIETTYRGARVVVPGSSSLGGVDTVEALNLLELAGLGRSGPPSRSSESLFWLMQITNDQLLVFTPEPAARRYPGRDFSPRARVTKEHARWLWERMRHGEWPYATRPAGGPEAKGRSAHSSGVVAVDRWGNVAAVTHTINTALWGNTGIFVGGVSIPDSASFQQDAIRQAGPGHRLPDQMSPLIVARDGRPVLASTAIGGGLHQRNIQVLAGVLEFGLNAQAAVDAPTFLLPDWTGSKTVAQVPAGAFDAKILEGVRSLGQEVKELGPKERAMFVGYWAGIAIDPESGRLRGAGTAELPSHAEGY
jgi:gamma-glutamyltranspeptidase / glutathione hydrolase